MHGNLRLFHAYMYVLYSNTSEIYIYSNKALALKLADHLVYYRQNNLEIYRGHLYITCAVREYLHSRAYFGAYTRITLFICCLLWIQIFFYFDVSKIDILLPAEN